MSTSLRRRPPGVSYADEDDEDDFYGEYPDVDADFQYEDWVDSRSEGDEGEETIDTADARRIRRDPYVPSPLGLGSLVPPQSRPDGSASPLSSLSPTPVRSRSSSPILSPLDRDPTRTSMRHSRPRSTPRAAHSLPAVSLSPRSRQPRPFPMALPRPATPPLAHRISDSSNSASDSSEPVEVDPLSAPRRFTAQEKGKGRAVVQPIEVEDEDPDESIEIIAVKTGEKRKRAEGDDMGKEDVEAAEEGMGLEERGIGAYMCPVCFSPPEQAVMTDCGHILCAKCLHDSLVAAIRRNPNPYPQAYPGYAGNQFRPPRAGAGGGRGAARTTRSGATRGRARAEPVEWNWTAESLKSAWSEVLIRKYEAKLENDGVERENWELIKENDSGYPREEALVVKEELKGLWSIDGKDWVIEGECPVCRKQIPGGYAPPESTLGGVIPLFLRIESGR